MHTKPITHQINETALKILEDFPEGIRRKDFLQKIEQAHPDFHPKTINGCVWLLHEKFPELVYKPERGVWKLVKYK